MEEFTLATCVAICRTTCVEEREQCVQECAHASQMEPFTLRHMSKHMHVLNIDDAGHADVRVLSH